MGLTDDEMRDIQSRYQDLVSYQDDDPLAPIDPMTYIDTNEDGLLHIAAGRGDLKTIRRMLGAGADVNQLGDMGQTPLHWAYESLRKMTKTVDFLIANGASLEIRDEFGKRPADRE